MVVAAGEWTRARLFRDGRLCLVRRMDLDQASPSSRKLLVVLAASSSAYNFTSTPRPPHRGLSRLSLALVILLETCRPLEKIHACTVVSDSAPPTHASLPNLPPHYLTHILLRLHLPVTPPATPRHTGKLYDCKRRSPSHNFRAFGTGHRRLTREAALPLRKPRRAILRSLQSPKLARQTFQQGLHVRKARFPSARRNHENQEAGYIAA